MKRRMREHGSSHADDIFPIMQIKVPNVRMVEQCSNFWLRHKKYRKNKEVYQGDVEMMMRSIVVSCGLAATAESESGLFVESSNKDDPHSPIRFTIASSSTTH